LIGRELLMRLVFKRWFVYHYLVAVSVIENRCESEWIYLQRSNQGKCLRFLFQHTSQTRSHKQHLWFLGDWSQRSESPRTQHTRCLSVKNWLCPRWHKPPSHPPTCHWDCVCPWRPTRCGVHNHIQCAHIKDH